MKFDYLSKRIDSLHLWRGGDIDVPLQGIFHYFDYLSLICLYNLIILVCLESICKVFFRDIVFL